MADPHAETDRIAPAPGTNERAVRLDAGDNSRILLTFARSLDALDRRLDRIETRLTTGDAAFDQQREKINKLDAIASRLGWFIILAVLGALLGLVVIKGGATPTPTGPTP